MGIILVFVIGFVYFIPAVNAYSKKKRNAGAVLALNLFLGWTFIGWIVALVWSISNDEKTQPVVIHTQGSSIDLEKLADLKTKGLITEEEFQTKKKQLLGI